MLIKRRDFLMGACLSALAGVPARAASKRNFVLMRDGADIGRHELSGLITPKGLLITIEIEIAVRFLGITAYRYEHFAQEIWRGGKLQWASGRTNDDGETETCTVVRTQGGLMVDGAAYRGPAPDNAPMTSYWNYAGLQENVWISSQSGALLSVSPQRAPQDGALERWNVDGDLKTSLFYDASREWRGTSFEGRGEEIAYREISPGRDILPLISQAPL